MKRQRATAPEWIETEAVVTGCRFQFARLNTLRMGLQTGEKFRIEFEYYGLKGRYEDAFESPVAIAQGERIRVAYNPLKPEENSRSGGSSMVGGGGLVGIGIAGSILLSLLWLAMMRGCG